MEKHQHCRRPMIALGCALVVLLAGCGVSAAGGGSGPGSANPVTATATASASAATATATASGATSGAVTLSVGAGRYSVADRIAVTIHNDGSTIIYAQQHNTSCSVVLLERLVNGVWQPVFPCVNGFPHPTVGRVAAGASVVVQLVPIVTGDAEATGGIQWQAGTYRAELRYVTNQTTSFGQGTAVYSGTFAIV